MQTTNNTQEMTQLELSKNLKHALASALDFNSDLICYDALNELYYVYRDLSYHAYKNRALVVEGITEWLCNNIDSDSNVSNAEDALRMVELKNAIPTALTSTGSHVAIINDLEEDILIRATNGCLELELGFIGVGSPVSELRKLKPKVSRQDVLAALRMSYEGSSDAQIVSFLTSRGLNESELAKAAYAFIKN